MADFVTDAFGVAVSEIPERNVPLMRKVLEHIEQHPDEWIQSDWVVQDGVGSVLGRLESTQAMCGTAHCFAGWALAFSGHELTTSMAADDTYADTFLDGRLLPDRNEQVAEAACAELGITRIEGRKLFAELNDLERIKTVLVRIVGEEIL